jgi:hypothetical protein
MRPEWSNAFDASGEKLAEERADTTASACARLGKDTTLSQASTAACTSHVACCSLVAMTDGQVKGSSWRSGLVNMC